MEERGLKQDQVAEVLGISQSAVSKYFRKVRGQALKVEDLEEIRPFISGIVTVLMSQTSERTELLSLFCQACLVIRKMSLMCAFCRKSDTNVNVEECRFCMTLTSEKGREVE
jgi:predicted transcriptional regulator